MSLLNYSTQHKASKNLQCFLYLMRVQPANLRVLDGFTKNELMQTGDIER